MAGKLSVYQKFLQGTVYVFSVLLLLYVVLFQIREATKVVRTKNSGGLASVVRLMPDMIRSVVRERDCLTTSSQRRLSSLVPSA